jgi:hypothetical protein
MLTENLAIVINYCSNDSIFIDAMLRECEKIGAGKVTVVVGSRFFVSLQPENIDHLRYVAERYPWVQFVLYDVYEITDVKNPLLHRKGAYWHNIARIHGTQKLDPKIEWVLFLDADEIPEGERFRDWFQSARLQQKVYKMANYWYFLDPELQSTTWEDSVMLVPRAACCYAVLMHDLERDGIPIVSGLEMERNVVAHVKGDANEATSGLPMFHHFSWVRSKEGLMKKVKNWAHKDDTDWEARVEKAIATQFDLKNDVDFVHGYSYVRVPNWFGIKMS